MSIKKENALFFTYKLMALNTDVKKWLLLTSTRPKPCKRKKGYKRLPSQQIIVNNLIASEWTRSGIQNDTRMFHFKVMGKIFESKKEPPKFFPLKKIYCLYIVFQKGTYAGILARKVLWMDHSSNLSFNWEKKRGRGLIFDNFNNYGRLRYNGHNIVRGAEKYLWYVFYNGDLINSRKLILTPQLIFPINKWGSAIIIHIKTSPNTTWRHEIIT